jgi:hypothetical protein
MAVIDPRLLPLIETLAVSGADWLAFEIVDGIRVGQATQDSEEELNDARLAVREFRSKGRPPKERERATSAATPIVGDEQIDWAAGYVADRLSEAVLMLEASLTQLESIVLRNHESDSVSHGAPSQSDSGISLRMEGEEIAVRRIQVDKALVGLSALREALSQWSEAVRLGGHN